MLKSITFSMVTIAAVASSVPAAAVITDFAQFVPTNDERNTSWKNNGASNTSGTGGRLYSTTTGTSTSPGEAAVYFEFVNSPLAALGLIKANFFMDISVASGNPANQIGLSLIQPVPSGNFSFTNTEAFSFGGIAYAGGSNLLTGTFTSGEIFGSVSSGGFSGDSLNGTLIYTSDVLDFGTTTTRSFSMALTSIIPSLFQSTAGGDKALRSFRATAQGFFATDPAPMINIVPEPQAWAMLVVGFGLIGVAVRRRNAHSIKFA